MIKNLHTSQRESTAEVWTNNRQKLDRKSLIDQVAIALNRRANEYLYSGDDTTYNRMIKQAQTLSTRTNAELAQYAVDLGITVVRL
jgi:hypothetical protein